MSFLYLFLVGILIGTAVVIPGVSGGVLAVIFNLYDKIINAINNLFKDFKSNFLFLIKIGFGIIIGAVWFSRVMLFLYHNHECITKFAFIGLILGGIPYLFKEIRKKTNSKVNYFLLIITFILSLSVFYISNLVLNINLIYSNNLIFSIIAIFIAGFIYASGKIIPGVSGSFLLIIMGMYEYILKILSNPFMIKLSDLKVIIPFLCGLLVGIIFFIKLMNYLLENKFKNTYSIIIGFVISSVISLIPNNLSVKDLIFGIVIMIFSFLLSNKISS